MEFKVLTEEERVTLRKVKTSPEQAQQILNRCKPILAFLKGLPRTLHGVYMLQKKSLEQGCNFQSITYDGEVGCPHCIEARDYDDESEGIGFNCEACAWAATVENATAFASEEYCIRIPFGGVTWLGAGLGIKMKVEFQRDKEIVSTYPQEVQSELSFADWNDRLDKLLLYIEGHIEWALGVKTGEL